MNIYLINQMFQPAPFAAEVWGKRHQRYQIVHDGAYLS
jgi:hypothetical protein